MKKLLFVVLLAAVLALMLAAVARADPPATVPNRAWVIPGQNVSVEHIYTNEELTKKLMDIDKRSDRCVVEQAGWSAGGGNGLVPGAFSYPIWVVKFGDPDPTKHENLRRGQRARG